MIVILIKIPFLIFFLTFFTACDLFSLKQDVKSSVSPEPDNTDLPVDSSAKTTFSNEEIAWELKLAVVYFDTPRLQKLLKIPSFKQSVTHTAEGRKTFVAAVRSGSKIVAESFLKAGIDFHTPFIEGNNFLMLLIQGFKYPYGLHDLLVGPCLVREPEESLKIIKAVLSKPAFKENINM